MRKKSRLAVKVIPFFIYERARADGRRSEMSLIGTIFIFVVLLISALNRCQLLSHFDEYLLAWIQRVGHCIHGDE